MLLLKNNAYSVLAAALTNSDTTLVVQTGHGDRFPVVAAPDTALLTLQDASNNIEIVRITARTAGSDSMTIQRAQDGTTARSWNIGDVAEIRLPLGVVAPLQVLDGASSASAIRTKLGATAVGSDLFTAADVAAARAVLGATATGVAVFTAVDQPAARSALGATAAGQSVMTAADLAAIRTLLGLVVGTDVQAYDAATAKLNVAQVYTKAQRGGVVDLADGATITPNFADGNMFRVQLGGNRILANPTNLVKGQSGSIDLHQDNTGSRTLTYGWGWQFAAGVAPALTTAARAKDKLTYQVDEYKTSNVTISIASPGVVTWAAHGLLAGTPIRLNTTGALPTGLAVGTTYYVIPASADTFQLSATQSGTAINTTGSQSGTHTAEAISISAALMSAVR